MKANYNPNRYLNHQEMTELLQTWAQEFPEVSDLQSIGKSREGKDIWMMTLTDSQTGQHNTKPAYWISGNIHASELSGCQASLHVINKVLSGIESGSDRFVELLKHNTLYVVPKISPDGADFVMKGYYVRSTNSIYPQLADPCFRQQDLDGDGQVRSLLVPSRSGSWKKSKKDPRILLLREPSENSDNEVYYHLYPEGRPDPEGEGKWSQFEHGQDYNRNFPSRWRPEGEQMGAGKAPLANPETEAVAKAVLDRPNIVGAQDFHTFSAIILRPGFFRPDTDMDHTDLKVFKTLGKKGEELTGYPCVSVAEDFCYDHKNLITGGFLDWMYEALGIYGYTNEIWSVFKHAGIEIGKSDHVHFLLRAQSEDELLKVFKWCDENADEGFFKPWQKIDHPDFGEVEIGGWGGVSPISNPPSHLLGKEVEGNAEFALYCAEANPRIEVRKKDCRPIGSSSDTKLIEIELENTGYLGTRGASVPGIDGTTQSPYAKISLQPGQSLFQGKRFQSLTHLSGRCQSTLFDSQFFGPLLKKQEQHNQKQKLQWAVQGAGVITVEVNYPRGGSFEFKFDS